MFLDFSKAFDRVPHHRLIDKLSCLGIDPLVVSWIRDFLFSRTQFTVANNHKSNCSRITSGVPQGSVLGPLLFLIFINDLPNSITSSIRLFADDCVLYRKINSHNNHLQLQSDLSLIYAWCSKWLMSLNMSKCKLVRFTRKKTTSNFSYIIGSDLVDSTSHYKYLGVTLTSDLIWNNHIETIVAEASRTLGYIKRNLKEAPSHLRKLAYETYVRPKLEYASAIWSPHQAYLISHLESIQNRAVRFILNDYFPTTSVSSLKHQLDIQTLNVRRKITRLSLFHKVYHFHPILRSSLLLPPSRSSSRLNHSRHVSRITGRTNYFNQSFFPQTIIDWNDLPPDIVAIDDPTLFRDAIISRFY